MLSAYAGTARIPSPPARGSAPRDVQDRIWSALQELTPRERTVLVLASRDRLDDDEIARVLAITRKAVRADASHAAIVVREVLAAQPAAPEDDAEGAGPPPPAPWTGATLDAEIKATLAARADDVRPSATLVDEAREQAERQRRERRSRRLVGGAVAAGLLVVVALGGAVLSSRSDGTAAAPTSPPASVSPTVPRPSNQVSGSGSGPAASVVALPDSVLRLAHDNDALLAFGSAIVDSSSGTTVVSLETDPATGASTGDRILSLARASGGYVVLTGGEDVSGPEPLTLSYVRPDGSRMELGRVAIATSGFAVSPDGLSVVHVIKGPQQGENAIGSEQNELVVQTLGGDVVNRVTVEGDVLPVSVTDAEVVFRRFDLLVSYSYVWQRTRDTITRLDAAPDQVPVQIHDNRALWRSEAPSACVQLGNLNEAGPVDAVWSRCGLFRVTQFDATGSSVAVVKQPEAAPELLVLDAGTGVREYGSQLRRGFPFQLQWTAASQKVLVATTDRGSVTYTAVAPGSDGLVVTSTYEVPEGPVVLGLELPLPAG